jgi:hypothetical protein
MDKAKIISDLYKEKSNILRNLSELSDPGYSFVLGRRLTRSLSFGSDILGYGNIDDDFISQTKEKLVAHYKNKVGDIDNRLEEILK